MVIDDDEFFLLAAQTVLRERMGVTGPTDLIVCMSAAEAMNILRSRAAVGTCLVDLNMPGTTNAQLLEDLRKARPGMRLIVVSSSRAREDVLMALAAGARGFIQKGLGIGELERALHRTGAGAVHVPPWMEDAPVARGDARSTTGVASLDMLTPRQMEVLRLLTEGRSNKAIARCLALSPATVKFHLAGICRALRVRNRVEAASLGARLLDRQGDG
jgi:DNA-binding NarL/FixJ family response regulator